MAQTVAQHPVSAFTSPVNNTTPIDANAVRGNDNALRGAYVDHDADPGIHLQSSALASRPAASSAGRKWLTADTGSYRLFFDDGTNWQELSYLSSAGGAVSGPIEFPDGSASAPSVTNTGDTNTGLFFPSADTVSLTAGGTEGFRLNDKRYVRISTDAGVLASATDTHFITNSAANQAAVNFQHRGASNPNGLSVAFTAAAPNNQTEFFATFLDNAATRATVYSNGDILTATGLYGRLDDTNTYFQLTGTDTATVVTGGTTRVTVNTAALTSTLPFVAPAGSAAAAAYTTSGDLNTGLFFPGADILAGATAGTERWRTTAAGYFKADTAGTYSNPTGTFHEIISNANGSQALLVANTGNSTPFGLGLQFAGAAPNNTTQWFLAATDTVASRAFIYSNGTFGSATNTYGAIISERRFKQDIQDVGSQWADIKALRLRKFRFIKDVEQNPDTPLQLGVIIDELEQVSPGLVTETPVFNEAGEQVDTHKGWKSSIAYLKAIGALQEAMARIEALEARLAAAGIA